MDIEAELILDYIEGGFMEIVSEEGHEDHRLSKEVRELCDGFMYLLFPYIDDEIDRKINPNQDMVRECYAGLSDRLLSSHHIRLPSIHEIDEEIEKNLKKIAEVSRYMDDLPDSCASEISGAYKQMTGIERSTGLLMLLSAKGIRDLVAGINGLGVYAPEEWEKYKNYFTAARLFDDDNRKSGYIADRILLQKGMEPATAYFDKLSEFLEFHHDGNMISHKVVKSDSFAGQDPAARPKIGLVSGCYDLLHLGHIRSMAYAKQFISEISENSSLVALTLSDENINKKKGQARPVLDLNERLTLLSGLKCVDFTVPLDQPNCLAALEAIRPDYFFKAYADNAQGIVKQEMDLVKSYGGKVVVFPDSTYGNERGFSTSGIIEEVLKR